MPKPVPSKLPTWFVAAGLLLAAQAYAVSPQVSIEDGRFIRASAEYFGDTNAQELRPVPPFADFNDFVNPAAVDEEQGGDCAARAAQISSVVDSIGYIVFTGQTEGGWTGPPSGTWSATSLSRVKFRLLGCTIFTLSVTILPGDCLGLGVECNEVRLEGPSSNLLYQQFTDGTEMVSDRLPPGEYVIEGRSSLTSGLPYIDGGTYTGIWNCNTCPWSIIKDHPPDKKVPPGTDPLLIASASVPTAQMSYQWRFNLLPLVNDGRITGATTNVLKIHNVAAADSGYYDVVFTDSSNPNNVIVEPSRLAHLELDTMTGVDGAAGESPRAFTLGPASPSPFARATSFRYEAASPVRAKMAIYNVAGARVRVLVDGTVSGARTVTWDGTMQSGRQAPAGVYYLHVEVGAVRESRKIVLLR